MATLLIIALLGCCAVRQGSTSATSDTPTVLRGGSVLDWADAKGQNTILDNYYAYRPQVLNELSQMRTNGQDTIGISTWVADFTSCSNDYALVLKNLPPYLDDIKTAGFRQVLLAFGVPGPCVPQKWSAWDESSYQQYLTFVRQVHSELVASGIEFTTDLWNEATYWAATNPLALQYCQRLWQDYTSVYGFEDTVGMSFNDTLTIYIMPSIYGDHPPSRLDYHDYSTLSGARNELSKIRYKQPLLIGETYYDSQTIKSQLTDVLLVVQWPTTYNALAGTYCNAVPLEFIY